MKLTPEDIVKFCVLCASGQHDRDEHVQALENRASVGFDNRFSSMRPQYRLGEDLRVFNLADYSGVVFEIGNRVCKLSNENARALHDLLTHYLEDD